jgi:hypothetical protein
MVAEILAFLFLSTTVASMYSAWRLYRKCVIYDEIIQFIYDDLEINLRQFGKMSVSAVTQNEPEVQAAHRNMMIMGKRFNEILTRMEEATGLRLRPPPPPRPPQFG